MDYSYLYSLNDWEPLTCLLSNIPSLGDKLVAFLIDAIRCEVSYK
jgi:hypothetical protein